MGPQDMGLYLSVLRQNGIITANVVLGGGISFNVTFGPLPEQVATITSQTGDWKAPTGLDSNMFESEHTVP